MRPDRFARLKELVLAVADMGELDRQSFLDDACKDDLDLRREVESMLAHDADSGPLRTAGGMSGAEPRVPPRVTDRRTAGDQCPNSASYPARIGPYAVEGELGRGGMGVVYLARDPRLKREVAVKLLPESVADDPQRTRRLEREAQLLATLNHPNIATIYSLEVAGAQNFITLEVIPGDTLAERIKDGPLTIDEALPVFRQIAMALEAAHKKGVVHRDIKPGNVKITPAGLVKVLDFGIAKGIAPESFEGPTPEMTLSTGTLGTPGYTSPEQVRGQPGDHRADIWSLGCTLFECLVGSAAFPGRSVSERLRGTLEREPDWGALPRETPERLRYVLTGCLAKDPGDRLASVAEVRRALEEEITRREAPALVNVTREGGDPRHQGLPVQPTSFIGRTKERAQIKRSLGRTHLLTLIGAGGCGKSRLALEVAREQPGDYPDGAWFVELAPLSSPELVPQTVATVLGLKEAPRRSLTQTVADHLEKKRALLLLDNCEHLLGACGELAETLVESCTELRILATSREGLGVAGETTYRVPPLGLPDAEQALSLSDLGDVESVRLFQDRGRAVHSGFAVTESNAGSVVEICRGLDGIPLAIELAAARVRTMSAEEIARRLDDRFRVVMDGERAELPHHQTLRAMIDWSYDQLAGDEQALLRRLSVFAGGWTLEAAEAVCAGDGIEEWEVLNLLLQLASKSLVDMGADSGEREQRSAGNTRYRMLETVRQYAGECLKGEGEDGRARTRHRDYFLTLAEQAEPELSGAEQGLWLSRLDVEHNNLRAALDCCLAGEGGGELGQRLAGALGHYWGARGHWSEGRRVCAGLLLCPEAGERTTARAKLLTVAGRLALPQGDLAEARSLSEESLTIYRELGRKSGIASSLNNLGLVAMIQGEYAQARSLHGESLAIYRKLGRKSGIASSLINLGYVARNQGEYAEARSLFEESVANFRDLGDQRGIAMSLNNLGVVAMDQGDYARARSLFEESLAIKRELGEKQGIAWSLNNLGVIAMNQGEYARARSLHEESLAITRELGEKQRIAVSLNSLGVVALYQGDYAQARCLCGESLSIRRELGDKYGIAVSLNSLGMVARAHGDYAEARSLHEESLAITRELGDKRGIALSLSLLGIVAMNQGDYAEARSLLEEGLGIFRDLGEKQGIAGSLNSLGNVALHQGDYAQARSLLEQGLAIFRDVGEKGGIAECLVGLGCVANDEGRTDTAVRLLASGQMLAERITRRFEPPEQERFERCVSALRARVDEETFTREWAAGQEMSVEQAVAYALGEGASPEGTAHSGADP